MRKAQAAMEFLMTYGWALLVVLVAIAALAFFGVLNPGQFLPQRCSLAPGLACNDYQVTDAGAAAITVIVQNGLGIDAASFQVTAEECYNSVANGGAKETSSTAVALTDGETKTITLDCYQSDGATGLTEGTKLKTDFKITYKSPQGIDHLRTGILIAEVQAGS